MAPLGSKVPQLRIESDDASLLRGTVQLDGHTIQVSSIALEMDAGRITTARLEVGLVGRLLLNLPAEVKLALLPCAPGLLRITDHEDGHSRRVEFVDVASSVDPLTRVPMLAALANIPDEAWRWLMMDLATLSNRGPGAFPPRPDMDAFAEVERLAQTATRYP